jgi:NADH-quinone oxidoreductase subunit L
MSVSIFTLFLILPLASFIFQLSVGKRIGRNSHWVSLSFIFVTLCIALGNLFSELSHHSDGQFSHTLFKWIDLGTFKIEHGFQLDSLSAIMLVVVSLVSFLVHLYSTEYMKGDPRYTRYFGFLGLFTFSMNGIVLADNLIMMYVFWELVGLSSYLLIGFWFEKDSAANASKKAFLTNRVGDIGMFLGIMTIYFFTANLGSPTLSFDGITALFQSSFSSFTQTDLTIITIAGILIFCGAIGKSAQFPLNIWLPDAMEGPTPVSALIHAATMVAAGVYMTVRIFPFMTPQALEVVAVVGAVTAFGAAIIAITQKDIKKVLAYSTVSQLGYMVMAIGVGAYQAGFFHLTTHAMFKACLFLCSGSVIHAMHHALHHLHDHKTDPQDMYNMGGLRNKMPITYASMLIATLAIAGVPLFSGFLSKDMILAGTLAYYHAHHGWTIILPIAGFGAAVITAFYMFRLIYLTFHGEPARKDINEQIHESPLSMSFPLMLLAGLSFAFSYTFNLNPMDSHGWFTHLISEGKNVVGLNMTQVIEGIHHAHNEAMIISLTVAGIGIGLATLFYLYKLVNVEKLAHKLNLIGLYNLSFNKFYIDEIYDAILYRPFMWFCNLFSWIDWDLYDQKFIDFWGWFTLKVSDGAGYSDYNWLDQKLIDGFGKITNKFGQGLKVTQSGIIQNYLLGGVLGFVTIFIIFKAF